MTNMQRQVWEKQETGIEIEVEGMAVGERDMGPGPGLWTEIVGRGRAGGIPWQ